VPIDPTQLAAAYDHIVELIIDASPNAPVRRRDVETLVTRLRKEGRGGEALAAELLHRMVSYVDHEKPNALTRERLAFARGYVGRKLAQANDASQLTPTVRALVEVGQLMAIAAHPGRIGYRVPEEGMEHIAAMLKAQADANGAVTTAERDLLVYDLYDQGRGTEALVARYFYNFVDHRSPTRRDWCSVEDIDIAVEYAREKMLRKKDANRNGYSADEIAKFSTTALGFLHVGQMIEAGVVASLVPSEG